jgi:hypothetical protein
MNGLRETTFRNGRLVLENEAATNEDFETRDGAGETTAAEILPAAAESHGALLSDGCATQKITRAGLDFIPVPEATDTFQPVAHKQLVDSLDEALALRRFQITRSEFAVSPDGMRLFGLLEINAVMDGVRFAIGLRNSNDKSMRLGLVAGYRVTICDNMMFAGEFKPLLAKHTKGLDLIEAVSLGVDRIHRGFEPLRQSILVKRLIQMSDDEARCLIYQAFLEEKFPIKLIKQVHRNYFSPEWEDFRERTLWSLENAFTESFKELNPLAQYQTTARLGRFLAPFVDVPPSATATATASPAVSPTIMTAAVAEGGDGL